MLSTTSKPLIEFTLGRAVFSPVNLSVSSNKTEPSQPCSNLDILSITVDKPLSFCFDLVCTLCFNKVWQNHDKILIYKAAWMEVEKSPRIEYAIYNLGRTTQYEIRSRHQHKTRLIFCLLIVYSGCVTLITCFFGPEKVMYPVELDDEDDIRREKENNLHWQSSRGNGDARARLPFGAPRTPPCSQRPE